MRLASGPAAFIACVVVALVAGCRQYVPVTVRVVDWETGAPVAGATVGPARITPMLADFFGLLPPKNNFSTTGANGLARVRITPDDAWTDGVLAEAHGYMPRSEEVSKRQLRSIARAGERPVGIPDVVVRMYAEPAPRIVLIVQPEYRGFVRVTRTFVEKVFPPGRRAFDVSVDGPRPHMVELPRFVEEYRAVIRTEVRWPDGTVVPVTEEPDEGQIAAAPVGFWFTGREDRAMLLIGSRGEIHAVLDPLRAGHVSILEAAERLWRKGGATLPAQ